MKYLTTKLNDLPWVSHGFFTRKGGESEGIYGDLNCGWSSQDDIARVENNRAKVSEAVGVSPEKLITLRQVHSAKAVPVPFAWKRDLAPEADAMVTDRPGIGIGILTADCAPILFASQEKRIIGAAHAGWRGAFNGVIDSTVKLMVKMGADPSEISAAIGPCIGPQSYEVSNDFKVPFDLQGDPENERFFNAAPRAGHLIFDLPGYVTYRLNKAGVKTVFDTHQDTLTNEDDFFSYRRMTLRNEPDFGRQVSVIAIKE